MKGSSWHCRRRGLYFGMGVLVSVVLWAPLVNGKPQNGQPRHNGAPVGSVLTQLNGKRSVLLLVLRERIVDSRGDNQALLDLVLKADPRPVMRNRLAYDTIAKKLNHYAKKYKSMSAAAQISDADFIIVFNLLEYRHILSVNYPYGELFVIVKKDTDTEIPLGVVWKSQKIQWAGDAINDLIKDLKTARGEL